MFLALLLCLTQNWYDPGTPATDARTIYVSSSTGNDSNTGLDSQNPRRTIQSAKGLMRHTFPDRMLLKRGDTFNESFGQWKTSGRSSTERQIIGAYGQGARPRLLTGNVTGIFTLNAGDTPPSVDNVAILDLEFYPQTYTGNEAIAGVSFLWKSENWLIEGCFISGYQVGVVVESFGGPKKNIAIRNNVIVDCYSLVGSVGHGIYASGGDNLLIEGNIIDKNGWNESVPGAVPTVFRHGAYLHPDMPRNAIVRGNIISRSSSHGLTLRAGGTVSDNLFIQNSINVLLGGGSPQYAVGGIEFRFTNNVVFDAKNIDVNNPRGWAIDVNNTRSGLIKGNIFCHNRNGTFPSSFGFDGALGVGIRNVRIHDNIWYNWNGRGSFTGVGSQLRNISFVRNVIHMSIDAPVFSQANLAAIAYERNTFYSQNPQNFITVPNIGTLSFTQWQQVCGDTESVFEVYPFVDPTRDIQRYDIVNGGIGTLDSFFQTARTQSKELWNPAYTALAANAWMRQGFMQK